MSISISLSQKIRQELKLSQVITCANLMSVPDEVFSIVAGAISYNPRSIETVLQKQKMEAAPVNVSGDKVQTIFSSLVHSTGGGNGKGLIISPDLRAIEKCLGDHQTSVTPDVTYIARKNQKPEMVLSDHLKGSMGIMLLQIDSSIYPETAKLLSQLRRFDEWKRGKLREAYGKLGEVQREFLEDFNPSKYNLFDQEDLTEYLGLSRGTVSRILANRHVEARNLSGDQKFFSAKDLLVTQAGIKKYSAFPTLNDILREEFERKRAYSDEQISERVRGLARRTISKHLRNLGIPTLYERNEAYKSSSVEQPYKVA